MKAVKLENQLILFIKISIKQVECDVKVSVEDNGIL